MKKLTFQLLATVISFALCLTAWAGWEPARLDVSISTPVVTGTVTATGDVTVVALPTGTERFAMTVLAGAVLPPATNNTATFVRISEDGGTTNTCVFTNGAASASVQAWWSASDAITLALSESVTNFPVVTYSYIGSPAVTNITAMAGDEWQIVGARPMSDILPDATTGALSATYSGWDAEQLASFTNGAAAYLPETPARLSLFDGLTLTGTRCTNSPAFRIMRLRWID